MTEEENYSRLVWDASTRTKIWRRIGVQKTPTHDTTGLWNLIQVLKFENVGGKVMQIEKTQINDRLRVLKYPENFAM